MTICEDHAVDTEDIFEPRMTRIYTDGVLRAVPPPIHVHPCYPWFQYIHRRKPEGGFAIESHAGLDAVIPLPEIEASLPLAALYERVDLKA